MGCKLVMTDELCRHSESSRGARDFRAAKSKLSWHELGALEVALDQLPSGARVAGMWAVAFAAVAPDSSPDTALKCWESVISQAQIAPGKPQLTRPPA